MLQDEILESAFESEQPKIVNVMLEWLRALARVWKAVGRAREGHRLSRDVMITEEKLIVLRSMLTNDLAIPSDAVAGANAGDPVGRLKNDMDLHDGQKHLFELKRPDGVVTIGEDHGPGR